jgi:FixJ family two-component response regulator
MTRVQKSASKKRALNRNYCGAGVEMFVHARCMKTPIITLLTNDHSFEECVTQVLLETGGLNHLAQSPSDVMDLVCTTGQDLDLAVIDCEHGPHGLTLVAAINNRREAFPVIVLTGPGDEYIEALAYANGATVCLRKPVSAAQLAEAMKQCGRSQPQPAIVA